MVVILEPHPFHGNNLNVKQIRLREGGVITDASSIAQDNAFSGVVYNAGTVGHKHQFSVNDGAGGS